MAVLKSSPKLKKGKKAPDFYLPGTDDEFYRLTEMKGERAYLIVFMCNHCPYVKAKLSELNRIHDEYYDNGLVVIGINSNDDKEYPEDSFDEMKSAVEKEKVKFLYLRDEDQEVAKSYGASCTPDPFLFDKDFNLIFHSRIDDAPSPNKKPTKHELFDAIGEFLNKGRISIKESPSMGCSIKWKK